MPEIDERAHRTARRSPWPHLRIPKFLLVLLSMGFDSIASSTGASPTITTRSTLSSAMAVRTIHSRFSLYLATGTNCMSLVAASFVPTSITSSLIFSPAAVSARSVGRSTRRRWVRAVAPVPSRDDGQLSEVMLLQGRRDGKGEGKHVAAELCQ